MKRPLRVRGFIMDCNGRRRAAMVEIRAHEMPVCLQRGQNIAHDRWGYSCEQHRRAARSLNCNVTKVSLSGKIAPSLAMQEVQGRVSRMTNLESCHKPRYMGASRRSISPGLR